MKRFLKYTSLLMAAALVVVSCLNNNDLEAERAESMKVRLWADMGYSPNIVYSPSATRGNANSTSGIIDAATDTLLTIGMARIDEVYSLSYPAFVDCGEPILAEVGRPNPNNSYIRDINFKSAAQFFYNATDYVKYVAWQPWYPGKEGYEYNSTSTATIVRMPITGDSDILY